MRLQFARVFAAIALAGVLVAATGCTPSVATDINTVSHPENFDWKSCMVPFRASQRLERGDDRAAQQMLDYIQQHRAERGVIPLVETLARNQSPTAKAALPSLLHDEVFGVYAAWALAARQDSRGAEVLRANLKSPDPRVRDLAEEGLWYLTWRSEAPSATAR